MVNWTKPQNILLKQQKPISKAVQHKHISNLNDMTNRAINLQKNCIKTNAS